MLYTKTVYYLNANPPIPPGVTTAWVLTVGYYVQDTVNTSACYIDTRTTKEYTETYTLELAPASATVESGKTLTFTATVKNQDGDPPSVPVPVAVEVEVEPFSGGHDHGETYAARPKGAVLPASGTNALNITFISTEVSGTHIITATCDMCVNKTEIAMVDVMVPGLETIPASPFYAFIGGEAGKPHRDNHYLTPPAELVLHHIALTYQWLDFSFRVGGIAPLPLHLNDASLVWGGRFDTKGNWANPHAGHRRGVVVDVRANHININNGAIPLASFDEFIKMAAKKGAEAQVHCTSNMSDGQNRKPPACIGKDGSQDSNRHFHILLLGVDQ